MKRYTSVEEQIEFGIDTLDSDAKVEMPLRDFIFVHQTLGEFVRFFHQREHYPRIDDVHQFMSAEKGKAFEALRKCYYEKFAQSLPKEIEVDFEDGARFENPDPPYYYKEKAEPAGSDNGDKSPSLT